MGLFGLASNTAESEGQPAAIPDQLLSVPFIHNVILSITTRCNLRCTYCGVSQPQYEGRDLDLAHFDDWAADFKKNGVRLININGHGETTMIPGWEDCARKLLDAGFMVSITSNFAKEFSEAEVEVFSRMSHILVSIDTVDRKLFREIRRHGDVRGLLFNMQRIKAAAIEAGRTPPTMIWNCVVSDAVVFGLKRWASVGMASGVQKFVLSNLTKMPDVPDGMNVYHPLDMPFDDMLRARAAITEARDFILAAGCEFEMQSGLLDSMDAVIAKSMAQPGEAEAARAMAEVTHAPPTRDEDTYRRKKRSVIPDEGMTRDCLDAWTFAYIYPNGDVQPCCWFGHGKIGSINAQGFNGAVNGDEARKLRSELLTGNLRQVCKVCPSKSSTTPGELRKKIEGLF